MSETKTLAIGTLYGGDVYVREWSEWEESCDECIRLSEIVEVEFTMLPAEETNPKRVAELNEQIDAVRAKAQARIAMLEERRNKLLAITHDNVTEIRK